MINDLPVPPLLVEFKGRQYVAVDALVAAATDKQVLANAVATLKIGMDKGGSLESVLAHMLGGYALQVSRRVPGLRFGPEDLAKIQKTLSQPLTASAMPCAPATATCEGCADTFVGTGQICPECVDRSREGGRPL